MKTINIVFTITILAQFCFTSADEKSSKSILLVIDMQKDLLTYGKGGMKMDSSTVASLIQNINKNIEIADSLKIPVAYIQNLWTNPFWIFFGGNVCRKGDKETELDKRLRMVNSKIYEKSVPNSFSNKMLNDFIKENQIEKVFICGIKTEGCIGATVKSSLKKGYKTFIIAPAAGSNSLKRVQKDLLEFSKIGAITIDSIAR